MKEDGDREGERMRLVAPKRRYVVTGDREVTSVLTVHNDGHWELSKGTLYDVTHLPCRSARYMPASPNVHISLASLASAHEAASHSRTAVALRPSDAEAYLRLAHTLAPPALDPLNPTASPVGPAVLAIFGGAGPVWNGQKLNKF